MWEIKYAFVFWNIFLFVCFVSCHQLKKNTFFYVSCDGFGHQQIPICLIMLSNLLYWSKINSFIKIISRVFKWKLPIEKLLYSIWQSFVGIPFELTFCLGGVLLGFVIHDNPKHCPKLIKWLRYQFLYNYFIITNQRETWIIASK